MTKSEEENILLLYVQMIIRRLSSIIEKSMRKSNTEKERMQWANWLKESKVRKTKRVQDPETESRGKRDQKSPRPRDVDRVQEAKRPTKSKTKRLRVEDANALVQMAIQYWYGRDRLTEC